MKVMTSIPNQFKKAHDDDAGYDIIAAEQAVIYPGKKALISTGLIVAIPKGFVGIIKSRSGLAAKHDLEHGAGVIDSGYRGEVKILIRNFGTEPYGVFPGDKIAQMIILPIFNEEVEFVDSLNETERSKKGFNSTGYIYE
jgi:dUTP pyrophosphatase